MDKGGPGKKVYRIPDGKFEEVMTNILEKGSNSAMRYRVDTFRDCIYISDGPDDTIESLQLDLRNDDIEKALHTKTMTTIPLPMFKDKFTVALCTIKDGKHKYPKNELATAFARFLYSDVTVYGSAILACVECDLVPDDLLKPWGFRIGDR